MDRLIEQQLEAYLGGRMEPGQLAEFEKRLAAADDYTRTTVSQFAAQSRLLVSTLRPPEEMDPAPGFYARVMQRVEAQRVNAWWTAFLEPEFSRRLAYASLTLLVLLGITMVSTEQQDVTAQVATPAAVMAQSDSEPMVGSDFVGQDESRDIILGTLATYSGSE